MGQPLLGAPPAHRRPAEGILSQLRASKGLRRVLLLPLLATAVLLSHAGCATSRPSAEKAAGAIDWAPKRWAAADTAGTVTTDWISDLSFSDPRLPALIDEAMEANFQLQARSARVDASRSAAAISGAPRFPFLNLTLNSGRQKTRFLTFDIPGLDANTASTHSLSLSTQWEADIWGIVRQQHAAAQARFEADRFQLEALKLSLASQVARAWFNLIAAQKQLELAEQTAATFEDNLRTLEKRYQRGLVSGFDLRLTRAQAASSRAAALSRATDLDAARRLLEALLGRYPAGKLQASAELPTLDQPVPGGLPSELLSRRPDILAAASSLDAAASQSRIAQRNWLPRLTLTGSAGTTSNELSELVDTDYSVWSAFANLAAPLTQAGKLKAERAQARSLLEAAALDYQNAALTAFREVETALNSEHNLSQLEEEVSTAARENQEAESQVWDRYQRGLADITTVLDSQRRSFDSQSQLISVKNQRLQNRIDLHLALGGSFHE